MIAARTWRVRHTVVLLTVAAVAAAACGNSSSTPRSTGTNIGITTTTTARKPPKATTTTAPRPSTASAVAAIAAFAKTRQGTTDISIGDIDDGAVTDVTPGPQTPVRIASVVKISIAIGFLRQLHQRGQALSDDEREELTNMIEQSDNTAAEALWEASQRQDALAVTEQAAGITHTAYQVGHGWGFTLTIAHDQAQLEAALARGQMLDADDTALVLNLMHHVVSSEQWGFEDSVPAAVSPGIKNGWYEDTDAPVWRIHCTAIFDSPKLVHRFSIAVMTRYPATLGMGYGEDTCRGVAHKLGAWLTTK
jgi:hypothetical protein